MTTQWRAPVWLLGAFALLALCGIALLVRQRRSTANRGAEAPQVPSSRPGIERPEVATTGTDWSPPLNTKAQTAQGNDAFDERALERFLEEAGLRVTRKQGAVLLLERAPGCTLQNLAYAALLLDGDSLAATRSTMATVVFQSHASALYGLRGQPGRQLHVITVLRSLPGAGVYKEWHQLATAQYVRVLPVTPHEVSRALSEHSAPQLIASLTRRAQSDAFIHVEPVTNELEFFGRTQLERLVSKLLNGTSLAVFGLFKWGTTSLLYPETGLVEVYRNTGGHKYLARELGSALVKRHVQRGGGRVRSRDVAESIPSLVARHSHYFEAVFECAPRNARRALARLVNGPMGMVEFLGLAAGSPERDRGALPSLKFALDFGLVAEQAGWYELRIGLLGRWLSLSADRRFDSAPPAGASEKQEHVPRAERATPFGTVPPLEPSVVPGCHSGTNRPQPVAVPFGSAVPTIIGTPLDHPNGRPLTPAPAVDTDTPEPAAPSGPRRVERVGIGEGTIMLTTPPPDEQRALRELMVRICEPSELQIIAHDLGIRLDRIVSLDHGTELQALKLIDWSIRSGCYDRLKALVHARAPAVFDR